MSTVVQSAMSPGYCVKEDSVVYGFEEIDFDTDPDFDLEETKPNLKRMHRKLILSASDFLRCLLR
jgi:hypothetical protein